MGDRLNNMRAAARSRKMRAHNYRLVRLFGLVILLAAMLAAGFFLRGQTALLQQLGFSDTLTGVSKSAGDATVSKKDIYNSVVPRISEVEDMLSKDSLDTYDLTEATEKMLAALAQSSNDPYLRYYTPERYSSLLNSRDESYAGIGVLFSEYNGQAYAVDVFEGSQAQIAGVQTGDFVVGINGDNLQTWSRSEVASVLSQSEGSSVVITWRRPSSLEASGGEQFVTALTSQVYDEVNVTSEYDEERRVGYVKVKQLTANAAQLVQDAINDLSGQGAGAFVLDLRNNPGGYLSQAVALSSLFMNGGTVVEVRTVDGQSAKSATGQPATNLPLILITNKNTAAAAEVVAAALKDSRRATLVGERTLGKGSVQVISELSFGGALRYTAAYYLTPEGHDIDGVGVAPEIDIDGSGDGESDNQKEYAMSLAGSLAIV